MTVANKAAQLTRPVSLSIAGSDSSGGAGIQIDLRVFSALNVYGCTALTAITAQNPDKVSAVEGLSADFVQAQTDAIFNYFPVAAFKTGMLWSEEIIELTAQIVRDKPDIPCVVDPVMIATSGAKLVSEQAIDTYREKLLPYCTLMTPNIDEAQVLLDNFRINRENQEYAAQQLHERYGCAVLLKGGHLQGPPRDVLLSEGKMRVWDHTLLQGLNTHGSGCFLSAAITAHLALGHNLVESVDLGLETLQSALRNPVSPRPDLALAGAENLRIPEV